MKILMTKWSLYNQFPLIRIYLSNTDMCTFYVADTYRYQFIQPSP